MSANDEAEAALLTEDLLGVFQKLHGTSWGPLLAHQLRMAFRTVMSFGGSLRDVYDLFADPSTHLRLFNRLHNPDLQAFWMREFPKIPHTRRSTVLNKLAPIVLHPVLGAVLASRDCALDPDRLIAERQILCVNLATGMPGEAATTLLGTFLVHKIVAAAFRQAMLLSENRNSAFPHRG